MPTLCGLRRRGYTPASIRNFIDTVGVSTSYSVVDYGLLEYCIREDLNKIAPRGMAVLDPLKLVIDNYEEGCVEEFDAEVNPRIRIWGCGKYRSPGNYISNALTS